MQRASAARLSSVVAMLASNRARCSGTGSATVIPAGEEAANRLANASAMLPPPMKAMRLVIAFPFARLCLPGCACPVVLARRYAEL